MQEESTLLFDSFRLDLANVALRRGKHAVFLTPKAFTMLHYLVKHAGQLVTKDDLWQAVWPGVTVTDAALTVCMSEVRRALRDNVKTPKFIETVHRRGYRFIGKVVSRQYSAVRSRQSLPIPSPQHSAPTLVGRETELAQLHRWLGKALVGERQIVFVAGEAGIGKTTVVDAFLERISTDSEVGIGRGQCIEHFGAGEAYLPVLAALGQLGQEPGGERLIVLLDRYAPTWLAQMPALLHAAELEALRHKTVGVTRERMLREMAEAVDVGQQNGEHLYDAELYRLKGELTLQQSRTSHRPVTDKSKTSQGKSRARHKQVRTDQDQSEEPSIQEAEACFHKAIEIACQQRAKSLELRAVTSLSRLWQRQGKQKEAHQMLLKIYNWFTEGFDTADLQEAKALLEKLS